jgi:hypothetical protein
METLSSRGNFFKLVIFFRVLINLQGEQSSFGPRRFKTRRNQKLIQSYDRNLHQRSKIYYTMSSLVRIEK